MLGAVAASLGVYAGLALAARAGLRRVLFPAPRGSGARPDDARLLTLRAADGATVRALEVAATRDERGTVVYFHGNGETALGVVPIARLLADEGFRVVVLEYRGYGLSRDAGAPTETALFADAAALLEHLGRDGGRPPALWGVSLGTAVAVEMARRFPASALVLVCPFTSMRALVKRHARILPSRLVVRDALDSAAHAHALTAPTLVIHGAKDRLVPATMGRELAARIAGARYVEIPGAGHAIFASHGDDVVREALAHLVSAAAAPSG